MYYIGWICQPQRNKCHHSVVPQQAIQGFVNFFQFSHSCHFVFLSLNHFLTHCSFLSLENPVAGNTHRAAPSWSGQPCQVSFRTNRWFAIVVWGEHWWYNLVMSHSFLSKASGCSCFMASALISKFPHFGKAGTFNSPIFFLTADNYCNKTIHKVISHLHAHRIPTCTHTYADVKSTWACA